MTEGWCYGTTSVSALNKGHYCQRGLWEMAPNMLLFILALTACLTKPAHCDEIEGSGITKAEAESTEISTTVTLTSPVTSGTWNTTFTVNVQEEEVSGGAKTLAQFTHEQNSTTNLSSNKTTTEKIKQAPKSAVHHTPAVTPGINEENNTTQGDVRKDKTDKWKMITITALCLTLTLLLTLTAAALLIAWRRKKNTADPEKNDPYLDDDTEEKVPMPMFEDDIPSVMELEMEDFEKWMIKEGSNISIDSKQRHPS